MASALRILHLEDEPLDSELAGELLASDGLDVAIDRVDSLAAFSKALQQGEYALILSDYTIPGTDPQEALRLARRLRPEIPYIFLSGTLGEDVAIETLKLGASDYVLKHKIARLVPAIRRALLESSEQARRKAAEEALRRRTRSLKLLSDTATRLLQEPNPRDLIRGIFDELSAHLGLEIYISYLLAEDGQGLKLNALAGIHPEERSRLERPDAGESACGAAAGEKRRLMIEDVRQCVASQTELIRSLGARAHGCQPLLAGGNLVGVLSFGSRTRDQFSPEDLDVLRAVCDQVAVALERKRLVDEIRGRAAELNAARISAEHARAVAEQANAAKDQFIAVLSHELRTPLTAVLPALDALEPLAPAGATEYLDIARRNIELEARLIDDLLDVTRIARGKVDLHRKPVDLWQILGRAIEVCTPDLESRRLHFGARIPEDPCSLEADPARLQQVFWNLIKNAVKFTPDNGCIGIYARREGGAAIVEISDSGVGIDPAVIGNIFGAFYQVDRAMTRGFGGLGLGLAISRALVELHGGKIRVRSQGHGKGSVFTVELPLPAGPSPAARAPRGGQASAAATGRPPGSGRGLRILLVEDHPDTARIMGRLLSARGNQVLHAGTVAAALDLAGREPFDVLLSDIGLPDGTGHDLMRRLAASGRRVPAVAISGFGMAADIERSLEAGFAEHLTKPVSIDSLIGTLVRVTEKGKA